MKLITTNHPRVWLYLFFPTMMYAVLVAATTLHHLWRERRESRYVRMPAPAATPNAGVTFPTPAATAIPWPSPDAGVTPSPGAASPTPDAVPPPPSVAPGKLIIPVAGVRHGNLRDTYNDARSEGRVHNAIDIMAPGGTAVLAASDGEIARFFYSDRGGNTIYQWSPDKKAVFYYAHLERYADGLAVGQYARQGQVIAYVGDTGNAGAGNYHLHFSIWLVTDPKRYWDGVNINPYPILISTGEGK